MRDRTLLLGLYSAAEGAHALLASQDGDCLAECRRDAEGSVVKTALLALEPCLRALGTRDCHACLSLHKYADQISLGLLPGVSRLSIVRPQEALLSGTLGGRPGVVVHWARRSRGLGVDEEGHLKGLAQDEGGLRWMMDRLGHFDELRFASHDEAIGELMKRASHGSRLEVGLLQECVTAMMELLLHLLPQLRLPQGAPICWVGPGADGPLPNLLADCLGRYVKGLRWIKPQMSPAQGCVLLARAASRRGEQGRVDARTWRSLFQDS